MVNFQLKYLVWILGKENKLNKYKIDSSKTLHGFVCPEMVISPDGFWVSSQDLDLVKKAILSGFYNEWGEYVIPKEKFSKIIDLLEL